MEYAIVIDFMPHFDAALPCLRRFLLISMLFLIVNIYALICYAAE